MMFMDIIWIWTFVLGISFGKKNFSDDGTMDTSLQENLTTHQKRKKSTRRNSEKKTRDIKFSYIKQVEKNNQGLYCEVLESEGSRWK